MLDDYHQNDNLSSVPRPSLETVRREQILDAFAGCLAARGLEGTTLEAVAAEAGVQRSAIRHFVGNRNDLVAAAVEHLTEKYRACYAVALRDLPRGPRRGERLLDFLFLGAFVSSLPLEGVAIDALRAAASHDDQARSSLLGMYREFENHVFAELHKGHPRAPVAAVRGAAHSIVCLAEESASMQALGFPRSRARSARAAAAAIAAGLARR